MDLRNRAAGANTPWECSWFLPRCGMMAASLASNSTGHRRSSFVPSAHGRLKRTTSCPSGASVNRSWDSGGRAIYRHKRSRPSLSWEAMRTPACRLNHADVAHRFGRVREEVGFRSARGLAPARSPNATRPYILAVAMSATPRPMTTTCQRASQACALACEESVRCSWGRYTVPGISLARVAASSR